MSNGSYKYLKNTTPHSIYGNVFKLFFDETNQVSSSAHFYIIRNERTVSIVLLEPVGHSGAVTILRLPTHHRTVLLLFIVLQRSSTWIHWQYWKFERRASKALLTLRHTIKVRLSHTHTHTAIDLQIAADSQSAGSAALWLAFSECWLIYSWISLSLWPPSDTNTHTLFPLHVYVCVGKS